jgi:predicted phage terminase large subunit-like protein
MNAWSDSAICETESVLDDLRFMIPEMTQEERKEFDSLLPPPSPKRLERDFAAFCRAAWHVIEPQTKLVWGFHLDALCLHLQAVSERKIANLCVQVPPGTGKSTICSVLWPVWAWTRWPETRFLTASYALNLAVRDALRSRRIIQSPWYQRRWGHVFRLTSDQNVKGHYENDATGYRMSLSVGSVATGARCDFSLIDDPFNVTEAESLAVRLQTIQWHDEAFWNRLNDMNAGGRVLIGQRVAANDLHAHVLQKKDWTDLRISEEYEPDAPCVTPFWKDPRTQPGERLRPLLLGDDAIADLKKNSYLWSGQYQQRPTPREGALFKAAWFKRRFVDLGDGYSFDGKFLPYKSCQHYVVVDPAGGESEHADFTAIGTFAVTGKNELLIVDMLRERISLERIGPRVRDVCQAAQQKGRRPLFAAWEVGFLQTQLAQKAKELPGMPPIKEVDPGGKEKFIRAIPALILAETGQILLPDAASWLEDFLAELFVFTGNEDARDDQVDVVSYAAQLRDTRVATGARPITQARRTP